MLGNQFGSWTVLTEAERDKWGYRTYLSLCVCGVERSIRGTSLRNGVSKSCGCISKVTTHGMHGTRFYGIWANMKKRCKFEGTRYFKHYGGRGITYTERWESFENFRDDMYKPYETHVAKHGENNTSIDRIDNDGNYEPSNCRWATWSVQNLNRNVAD